MRQRKIERIGKYKGIRSDVKCPNCSHKILRMCYRDRLWVETKMSNWKYEEGKISQSPRIITIIPDIEARRTFFLPLTLIEEILCSIMNKVFDNILNN